MAKAPIEEDRLKELVKTAIVEVLEKRRELVRDVFEEALEDVALVHAIKEGKQSPLTSRDEVFKLLGRCGATTYRQPRRGGIVKPGA